jgi:hypothetical protein
MTTPTRVSVTDRVFDGLIERQATFFDVVRGGNDRINRFNHSLIEGARQGSREWAEVGRRFLTNPTDASGIYEAFSDAIGNSQARGLALVREWVEDTVQSQRETRDALRQGFGDVREVVQAVQESGPEFLRRRGNSRNSSGNGSKKTAAAES